MPSYDFYPIHHMYSRRGQRQSPPAGVPVVQAVVTSGSFLFIPAGWMHRVTALEPTIHFAVFALQERGNDFLQPVLYAHK